MIVTSITTWLAKFTACVRQIFPRESYNVLYGTQRKVIYSKNFSKRTKTVLLFVYVNRIKVDDITA